MSRGPGRLERRIRAVVDASDYPLRLFEIRGALWGWRPNRRGVIRVGQPGRWAPILRDDRAVRRALARLTRRGVIEVVGATDGRRAEKRYAPPR